MNNNTVKIFEGDNISDITNAIIEEILPSLDGIYETAYSAASSILNKFDPSFFRYRSGEARSLCFVGTFTVRLDDRLINFCCFPKYMKQHSHIDVSEMYLIVKAIECVGLTPICPEISIFNASKPNAKESQMLRTELAQWIVKDYLRNGIINIKTKQTSLKQRGNTNWTKTVSRIIPVTDGENFIYPQRYNTYYDSDNELLVSKLHRAAVAEALQLLHSIGARTDVAVPDHDAALLGRLSSYSGFIQKMLNRLYEDRQVRTLRSVLAWCTNYSRFYDKPIGTVSFELVWERCLRMVFDNVSENRIEGDFTFENPVYHIDNKQYKPEKSRGIPDIINIERSADIDRDKKKFMLLDAKYYLGSIEGDRIKGVPMYKDVSKQLYYYDMLCNYGLNQENGVNAFVMPVHSFYDEEVKLEADKWFRYIGYVDYSDSTNNLLMEKFNLRRQTENNKYKGIVMLTQVDPKYLFKLAVSDDSDENQKHTEMLRKALSEQLSIILN